MSNTNIDHEDVLKTETPSGGSSVTQGEAEEQNKPNDKCDDEVVTTSENDAVTSPKDENDVIVVDSMEKEVKTSDVELSKETKEEKTCVEPTEIGLRSNDSVETVEEPTPVHETSEEVSSGHETVVESTPGHETFKESIPADETVKESIPADETLKKPTSSHETVEEPTVGHETVYISKEETPKCESAAVLQSIYQIKWIKWNDSKVPIVTQNENGPCPLIAVINVLLLLGKVKLNYVQEIITSDQLMEFLGDCILESAPKNISEGARLNYEQNMHDAIAVVPKLQTGLDVNVKFTGVHDFEYTPECIIFDLLNIPLYHGWLVDPQAEDVVNAVGKLSYNQLVEKIITNKSSSNSDLVTEALIAENFLEKSASQLTYYGLCELNEVLKSNELAVLFRNNHFCTVFKHDRELLQLVTDQGFLTESNVVWETLSNIEGDCLFVDANFVTVPPKPASAVPAVVQPLASGIEPNSTEQINRDYLVALSLQEQQKREEEEAKVWQEYKEKELGATSEMTDEELARRLQAEEQRQATQLSRADTTAGTSDVSTSKQGDNSAKSTRQSSVDSRSGTKKKSDVGLSYRRK